MLRSACWAAVAIAVLILLGSTAQAGTVPLTGVRSIGSGLDGNGAWTDPRDVVLEWVITAPTVTDPYYAYQYTVTVNDSNGSVSHFTLEVSDSFSANDILGALMDGGDVSSQTGLGDANWPITPAPNVLKFDIGNNGKTVVYTLYTLRSPVWGDVLIKDGVGDAWNSNIGTDPTQSTTDFTGWIATPDTTPFSFVPLPAAAWLGLALLGGLGLGRRLRSKRRG